MFWLAIGATVAAVVGSMLHELTHAATARALGAEVRDVDLLYLFVEYGLDDSEPLWKDRLIGLSPLLSGLCVGLLWLAIDGFPLSNVEIVAGVGWAVYTLWGSLEDLSPAAAQRAAQ